MATYKVIQDIEAEDKLVGPLTLRQFIYAGVAAVCGYISFICISKGATFLLVVFLPPMLFGAFFAFPWGRDQPTEIWALAKIRFYVKSRRRIWDQSGAKELVTVTVPKKVEKVYTNGLSTDEVHSRLTALASTLDSRGWALKNTNANLYDPSRAFVVAPSDRLVDPLNSIPQEVSGVDLTPSDDMLDEANNPRAHELDQMMQASSNARRQQIIDQLAMKATNVAPDAAPELPSPASQWFMNKPLDLPSVTSSTILDEPLQPKAANPLFMAPQAADPTPEEEALSEELKNQREKAQQMINYQHLKVIQPLSAQVASIPVSAPKVEAVTPPIDPATIELAGNNDLSIATLARIANKEDEQPNEIVISLHNHDS